MRSAEKHKAASQGQQTIQSWSLYKRLGEWDDVIVGPDTGQSDEEGGAGTRVVEIGELADALAEVRRLRKALENIFPIVDRMAHRGQRTPGVSAIWMLTHEALKSSPSFPEALKGEQG